MPPGPPDANDPPTSHRHAIATMLARVGKPPICPDCQQPGRLVERPANWRERTNERWRNKYVCDDCDTRVGCHPHSDVPLGTMAGPALRAARMAAHAAFDPLWRRKMRLTGLSKSDARHRAYVWLATAMRLDLDDTHIGLFDEAQCRRVVQLSAAYR